MTRRGFILIEVKGDSKRLDNETYYMDFTG